MWEVATLGSDKPMSIGSHLRRPLHSLEKVRDRLQLEISLADDWPSPDPLRLNALLSELLRVERELDERRD
jgi:hypothetical protein